MTPDPKVSELLPCPFCGGGAEYVRHGSARQSMIIHCESCGARVESGDVWGLTAPAAYAWNRRTAASADAVDARRYAWLRQCTGGEWERMQDVRMKFGMLGLDRAIDTMKDHP